MTARPSLADLARDHAARRLNRKRRNAALRAAGYDPDGPDGDLYRDAFALACQAERVAEVAVAEGRLAAVTFLWDLPAEEWPAWVAAGCGDLAFGEYTQRLETVRAGLEAAGCRVVLVRATVAEVLSRLASLNLPNDPAGRAAAVGLIGTERHG